MRVRQITNISKEGKRAEVRYNVNTQLLYRQNRSHDQSMSLDCFIETLQTTKRRAKREGSIIIDKFIDDSTVWEQNK